MCIGKNRGNPVANSAPMVLYALMVLVANSLCFTVLLQCFQVFYFCLLSEPREDPHRILFGSSRYRVLLFVPGPLLSSTLVVRLSAF